MLHTFNKSNGPSCRMFGFARILKPFVLVNLRSDNLYVMQELLLNPNCRSDMCICPNIASVTLIDDLFHHVTSNAVCAGKDLIVHH